MTVEMVMSVLSRDRPGLVEILAQTVAEHGGNWIDSQMARLGGEFAGVLMVSIPSEQVDAFEQSLVALAMQDITVSVRRDVPVPVSAGQYAYLELTGTDHPGIVRDIARALARQGVSIDELQTEVFKGSMSGEQLFIANATIALPAGLTVAKLHEDLEQIAEDIMVDIVLSDVDEEGD